ncbi:MAG: hypothetical protein L6406_06910, partial [Desulfobacterales bacterium]|nr:hypothetical protein [Desulfobacterales bacterium]
SPLNIHIDPQILRSHPVKITSTEIRTCTPQAYYPVDAYAQGCNFMIFSKPAIGSNRVVCPD